MGKGLKARSINPDLTGSAEKSGIDSGNTAK
jgi:hypothetical protein